MLSKTKDARLADFGTFAASVSLNVASNLVCSSPLELLLIVS